MAAGVKADLRAPDYGTGPQNGLRGILARPRGLVWAGRSEPLIEKSSAEPTQAELDVIRRIYRSGAEDLARLLKGTDFQRGKASILLHQVDEISKRLGTASDHWVARTTRDKLDAAAVAIVRKLDPLAIEIGGEEWKAARPDFAINQRAVGVFARQTRR